MTLSEKLAEFDKLKSDFEKAIGEVKALQNAKIDESVNIVFNENTPQIKALLKRELNDELSSDLAIKVAINKENLSKECKEKIDEKMNELLNDESFNNELDSKSSELVALKIAENLDNFKVAQLRFQNAASVLSLCVVNELASLNEAYKILAQIEFYENKMANKEKIFKVYQVG